MTYAPDLPARWTQGPLAEGAVMFSRIFLSAVERDLFSQGWALVAANRHLRVVSHLDGRRMTLTVCRDAHGVEYVTDIVRGSTLPADDDGHIDSCGSGI